MPQSLEYGPREPLLRRRSFRRRVLLGGLIVFIAAWFTGSLLFKSGEYSSYVCTDCGLAQTDHVSQFLLLPIPFYRSRTPGPTRVSAVVARHNLMAGHTHQWRFVHGGSQGRLVVYRVSGDNDLLMAVEDGIIVDFVNNLAAIDRSAAERWLKGILDCRRRSELRHTLLFDSDYYVEAFNNPAKFPNWWVKNRQKLEQRLVELQRQGTTQ